MAKPCASKTDVLDRNGERVCNKIFPQPRFRGRWFGGGGKSSGSGTVSREQKEAEDLVREQAARLKAIFENSANMMIRAALDRGSASPR